MYPYTLYLVAKPSYMTVLGFVSDQHVNLDVRAGYLRRTIGTVCVNLAVSRQSKSL